MIRIEKKIPEDIYYEIERSFYKYYKDMITKGDIFAKLLFSLKAQGRAMETIESINNEKIEQMLDYLPYLPNNYQEDIEYIQSLVENEKADEKRFELMICENKEKPLAVARIMVIPNDSIHLLEIVFLEKIDDIYKTKIMVDFIEKAELYAKELNCNELYYEVLKDNSLGFKVAEYKGFDLYDESDLANTRNSVLLYKDIIRELDDEPITRSKQR